MFGEDEDEEEEPQPEQNKTVPPNQPNNITLSHQMMPMIMNKQENWQNNIVFSAFSIQPRGQEFSFGDNPSTRQNKPIFQLPN